MTGAPPSAIDGPGFESLAREGVPFAALLEWRVERFDPGEVAIRLPYRELILRPGGTISGPALMALADIVLWGLVMSRLGPMPLAVTTDMSIHFLRRPASADVIASGRLLKLGRRLAVGEVMMRSDGLPEPICQVTGTYAIPPDAAARR